MRQYNVWQLGIILVQWQQAECTAGIHKNQGDALVPREMVEKAYKPFVEYTRRECELLQLQAGKDRCDKFLIALRDALPWSELGTQAKVLQEAIQAELLYRRFAFVPMEKAEIWDKRSVSWSRIWEKFQEAKVDSERAIDCYALEQNTACVFHLMRVAEFGLRALAKKLGVKLIDKGKPQPIEYATWEKVIVAIKNKLAAAHAMSKGPRQRSKLQFYSNAADHCTYIRDVWRNDVAHTRGNYNDGEALGVVTRVRQFMELLATSI